MVSSVGPRDADPATPSHVQGDGDSEMIRIAAWVKTPRLPKIWIMYPPDYPVFSMRRLRVKTKRDAYVCRTGPHESSVRRTKWNVT